MTRAQRQTTRAPRRTETTTAARPVEWVVRFVVVAGLSIDAYVHVDLAGNAQLAAPGGIGGGALFRLQAAVAALVALLLLVTGWRWAYAVAFLAGLSALIPVLLYTYVEVPAIGPIPSMYEPIWYPQKLLSAVAEAVVVVLATVGWLLSGCARRPVSWAAEPTRGDSLSPDAR